MKQRCLLLACLALAPRSGLAGSLELHGVVAARGVWVQGQPSWLEGGFGRLGEGADAPDDSKLTPRGELHLGLDWKPSEVWLVHLHGVAHGEPGSNGGQRAGLAAGYVQFRPELTPRLALRFKAGTFFSHTSLENTDRLWQSPYSLTPSALNAWLGEEVRLTGLDSQASFKLGAADELDVGGAVFAANDTAGTLLAWRGWSLGDRLVSVGERLPLPPLRSFAPGEGFADQAPETRPVDELDGRPGWQSRLRWSRAGAGLLQVAYQDKRGDRAEYGRQYSWRTSFVSAGLQARIGRPLLLVAEAAFGNTGMGFAVPGPVRVDVRFAAGYALLSWSSGRWRVSARYDRFHNSERDHTAEPNDESGWAWTAAVLWKPVERLRIGVEYLELRAQRPAAAYSGADPDTNARRALLEARLSF
jgi:hypothetical protein